MKSYRTLQKISQMEVERRQRIFAEIEAELSDILLRLAAARSGLQEEGKIASDLMSGLMPGYDPSFFLRARNSLIALLEEKHLETEMRLLDARNDLLEAYADTKKMEHVIKTEEDNLKKELLKREAKQFDEIAVIRHARMKKSGQT